MLAFQQKVQEFSQWDDVRMIFKKRGILGLQDEFGDIVNSPLTQAFPNLVSLVQFKVSGNDLGNHSCISSSGESRVGGGRGIGF